VHWAGWVRVGILAASDAHRLGHLGRSVPLLAANHWAHNSPSSIADERKRYKSIGIAIEATVRPDRTLLLGILWCSCSVVLRNHPHVHTSTELCNTTDQGLRMGRCGTRSFFYVTSVELQAQQTSISDAIQIRSTKVKPKSPSAHPHRYTTILGTVACSQLEARRVALHKSAQPAPHNLHDVVPG
jgi:hypothetical protein